MKTTYPSWMTEDLARSGLTVAHAKKLGFLFLPSEETYEITGKYRVESYRIPYLDIDGEDTGFFRLRFRIPQLPPFKRKGKKTRYWQPKGSEPRAYFPHLGNFDWPNVANDPAVPLVITEGEKKAAAAVANGIACIGLGGVWNFRVVDDE